MTKTFTLFRDGVQVLKLQGTQKRINKILEEYGISAKALESYQQWPNYRLFQQNYRNTLLTWS